MIYAYLKHRNSVNYRKLIFSVVPVENEKTKFLAFEYTNERYMHI